MMKEVDNLTRVENMGILSLMSKSNSMQCLAKEKLDKITEVNTDLDKTLQELINSSLLYTGLSRLHCFQFVSKFK